MAPTSGSTRKTPYRRISLAGSTRFPGLRAGCNCTVRASIIPTGARNCVRKSRHYRAINDASTREDRPEAELLKVAVPAREGPSPYDVARVAWTRIPGATETLSPRTSPGLAVRHQPRRTGKPVESGDYSQKDYSFDSSPLEVADTRKKARGELKIAPNG
jgi:hypothetical protein